MFKFLKRDETGPKNGEAILAEDALPETEDGAEAESEGIETTLSIPEEWNLTEEERYVYAFHNSESPNLKENQISIYGMELIAGDNQSVRITGLIRSTVTQTIKFEETTILLLGADDELLARKEFDLADLGSLPKNSSRPWDFVFEKAEFVKELEEAPTDWKLAFELKRKHRLDLEETWKKALDERSKETLEKIVSEAVPLKADEVNFMGFRADHRDDGTLAVSLLIRNGNNRDISLQQLPLGVKDATNEEVARGSFKLDDLTVKANTSKPWTFIFPKKMLKKETLDLSKWSAYPIQE